MEGTCPLGTQIESNDEGGMDILFALDQATMADEQLRSRACLENADQSKCGSALKGLKSKKKLGKRSVCEDHAKSTWSVEWP